MNGYLLSVIGTVLLSAILTAVIPEGKTSSIIKSVTRLACILTIVSPIIQFFQGEEFWNEDENLNVFFSESVIDENASFIQYYSEMRIEEVEAMLKNELEEKFMAIDSISVDWTIEREEGVAINIKAIKLKSIYVKVKDGSNREAMENMWDYLTQNYCSEVLIE